MLQCPITHVTHEDPGSGGKVSCSVSSYPDRYFIGHGNASSCQQPTTAEQVTRGSVGRGHCRHVGGGHCCRQDVPRLDGDAASGLFWRGKERKNFTKVTWVTKAKSQ